MKRHFGKKTVDKERVTFVLTADYKALVCSQARLGKKGYTIPKSILSKEDIDFLKKDLFVKPVVFGPSANDVTSFPVFRENVNKMYLPRFYGIQRYGLPATCDIEPGDTIDVPFEKPLRDYQDKIIGVYMDYVNRLGQGTGQSVTGQGTDQGVTGQGTDQGVTGQSVTGQGSGGILEVPCGRGKCLAKNTSIIMYNGSVKLSQNIVVGDVLMGDDGSPRNVLSTCTGRETMVRIFAKDLVSEYYEVNMSHILSLKHSVTGEIYDICVSDYLAHPEKELLRGYRVPIHIENATANRPRNFYQYGYDYDVYLMYGFAPEFINGSRKDRLLLLAGLIDNYGNGGKMCHLPDRECVLFIPPKANEFRRAICYLARSIGFDVHIEYEYSWIAIYLKSSIYVSIDEIPVRQTDLKRDFTKPLSDLTYEIDVHIIDEDDYYGFEIDGNRRFVLGCCTVTHNTVMGLKIISLLAKKTLILVHKEFLMNQWIERIGEFLPSARVGKIQGPVFDIDEKDIVIGIIQSLYDKEYSENAFSSFGLTIIDEVHRIGSEQFSRTLFKTITPYMLGISATVDRKDKLTRVLHMFIGDKIYTEKREDTDLVSVRAIHYECDDVEFNETEYDFKGSPKYSTMIVKLCAFGPRSDFIVRVVGDLLKENPENQIMILCHNRSLLTYLFESIIHRQIASVGYYVGGMKQTALQETETKQIVLATYAMAAEALDIKTLSTLVMVTPKTDVIQSVGRILRVKHDNPIIVDIVDKHDLFQNQWIQRRRFYKRCNYRIRQISSKEYAGMCRELDKTWKTVFEPSTNSVDNEPKGVCMIDLSTFA